MRYLKRLLEAMSVSGPNGPTQDQVALGQAAVALLAAFGEIGAHSPKLTVCLSFGGQLPDVQVEVQIGKRP